MEGHADQGLTFVTLYAKIVNELALNPCTAQETLARRLGMTMRTVQRHLNDLEREGYIAVDRSQKPFTYQVAWDRPLRYFEQLKLSTFRPDMLEKIARLER